MFEPTQDMAETPGIKSDNAFKTNILLGIIGAGLLVLGAYLIWEACDDVYPQIAGIVLGAFFGFLGLYGLITLYRFDSILIDADRVLIRSIFGNTRKVIYLKDISSWIELSKENKHAKWTELTIFTADSSYQLSSSNYHNYKQLKSALTKGKRRDLQKQQALYRSNDLYYAFGFAVLGGIFLFAAYHYQFNTPEIQANQFQRIRDVLIQPPSIEKGSKGYQAIQLHLKSYPEFRFDLDGIALAEINARDFESNVKVGDTLTVEVLKEEYQKKLSREIPLGFWDKTLNYSLVSVYGLRDQNRTYLQLADYNQAKQKDSPIGVWLFGLIGLWMLGTGIYMYYSDRSGQ